MTWINNQKGQDQEVVVVKPQKLGRGRPWSQDIDMERE